MNLMLAMSEAASRLGPSIIASASLTKVLTEPLAIIKSSLILSKVETAAKC